MVLPAIDTLNMTRKSHINEAVFWGSIVLVWFLILTFFTNISPDNFDWFFNSDALYLPSIYRDIIMDGRSIAGWHFNPSPNFFPDMPVYFLLMYITGGDFILSTTIFALLQYTAIIVLFRQAIRTFISPERAIITAAFSNLLLALFFVSAIYNHYLFLSYYLLANAYHTSVFTMSLASLLLYHSYLIKGGKVRLSILFILVLLCAVSDRIYLVALPLPILILSMLYGLLPYNRSRIFLSFGVIITASLASLILFNNLSTIFPIRIGSPHNIFAYNEIWASGRRYIMGLQSEILKFNFDSLLIILFLVSLVWTAISGIRGLLNRKQTASISFYLVFSFLFAFFVLTAPIVNGNFASWDCLRYNIYPIYLSILNIPVLIGLSFKQPERAGWITGLILSCFYLTITIGGYSNQRFREYLCTYPDRVMRIDSVAKEQGLKYGIGSYWEAKHTTMFSRQNLRVYAVYPDLDKYFHVANEHWFHTNSEPYRFALAPDIDPMIFDSLFGAENVKSIPLVQGMYIFPPFHYLKDIPGPVFNNDEAYPMPSLLND